MQSNIYILGRFSSFWEVCLGICYIYCILYVIAMSIYLFHYIVISFTNIQYFDCTVILIK